MFFRKQKRQNKSAALHQKLPLHIAIIMDGNGRWAKKRGLPRTEGHRVGARVFRKIADYCEEIGIRYLTVYAFSTENWTRPESEVKSIMALLEEYLVEVKRDYSHKNVRLRFLGDTSRLNDGIRRMIRVLEQDSREKTGMNINIALNYGGRAEITNAVRSISKKVLNGEINPEDISETTIESALYTTGQPDPDLIIRPSGEMRLSNFLLWQISYAELWFSNILWPDFTTDDLDEAIISFNSRSRRFGEI